MAMLLAAVMAITPMTALAETANKETHAAVEEVERLVSGRVHVGDVLGEDFENATVIEVFGDGSFTTMKMHENEVASVRCNHYKWVQITNPTIPKKRRVNSDVICYYNVYTAIYKCANKRCSAKRSIDTNIPVKHIFKNKKCTFCGRKQK